MFKDEVGIEREYFLLDSSGNIVEPALFGFPFDEFGFLVEMRTLPYTSPLALLENLNQLIKAHKAQAEALGLKLHAFHRHPIPKEFIEYLSKKYHYDSLFDFTANINVGTIGSHATGLEESGEYYIGTAGIHIHFSRKTEDGRRVQLPIYKIVSKMDAKFIEIIRKTRRKLGEYEVKAHGFEYRSLPTNADIEKVINFAFKILKEV